MLPGYAIPNISSLKAIIPVEREDGLALLVCGDSPDWYVYVADSIRTADDNTVLMPLDNPEQGRWHLCRSHFTALRLTAVSIPPSTGQNESALFLDATDLITKLRNPNNGEIIVFGGTILSESFGGNSSNAGNNTNAGNS